MDRALKDASEVVAALVARNGEQDEAQSKSTISSAMHDALFDFGGIVPDVRAEMGQSHPRPLSADLLY
jgi:hypothetical protein